MEKEKRSTVKIVLLVIGIILTVVFLPAIIFLPFGGGAANGVINCLDEKNVESMVKTSAIAGTILDEGWKKAEESFDGSDVKEDVLKDIFNRVLTKKDVEDIIMETWKAVEAGGKVDYDLAFLETRLNNEIDKIVAEVPEAAFKAWKGDKSSPYFTESFLDTMADEAKSYFKNYTYEEARKDYNDAIKKYNDALAEFGEVPAEYKEYEEYTKYASFDAYVDAKWLEVKEDLDLTGYVDISGIFSDMETEIEKSVNDGIASADVGKYMDILHSLQKLSKLFYVAIFGIVILLALILLIFYMFSPAGFYVTGAGMIIGGIICKIFSAMHGFFMTTFMTGLKDADGMNADLEKVIRNLGESILNSLEKSIWNFGKISFVLGIIMIGVGILLHVLRKNKEAGEAVDIE